MPLPPDTFAALRALIDNDPALAARLNNAKSPEEAARLLAEAVQAQGVSSNPNAAPTATATALSDSQLDGVSGGFISLADQFRGLPMGDLIGGPLMSAQDAQVRLAAATAAFIQQVGFKP